MRTPLMIRFSHWHGLYSTAAEETEDYRHCASAQTAAIVLAGGDFRTLQSTLVLADSLYIYRKCLKFIHRNAYTK